MLNCLLPDNEICRLELQNVLYVPCLGHCLVSWNVLRQEECCLWQEPENSELLYVSRNGTLVFVAKYVDNFPYLCLCPSECALPIAAPGAATGNTDNATNVVYWHFVLGHTSMINPSLYADGICLPNDIKKKNHEFFCNICVLAKSTHHVPKSHNDPQWSKRRRLNDDVESEFDKCRTSHPFDLVYSDLSGIVPVCQNRRPRQVVND